MIDVLAFSRALHACRLKCSRAWRDGMEKFTLDCSNTYIWLLVIFSLEIWNLSYKSSWLINKNYINT